MSEKHTFSLASIPLSILGIFVIHLIYGLSNLLISLLFWLLSYIPILKKLISWIFSTRGDTPNVFAATIAAIIAYYLFSLIVEQTTKKENTKKFTLILTGIFVMIVNVLFVIINLIYSSPILVNVYLAIVGAILFFKGKNI